MPTLTMTIRVTRPVRLRGGRSVPTGLHAAERVEGGWVVPHPSGMEGVFASVPAKHAVEVTR